MTKPKNPKPESLDSITPSEESNQPEEVTPAPVQVEVETHSVPQEETGFRSLIKRAANKLAADPDDLDDDDDETPKKRGRGRPKGSGKIQKKQETEEQFTNLFATAMTLVLAGWSAPQELKPDSNEVNAVAGYSVSILLRHVPITGKLSGDALDIIGIVAVISGYYMRVGPDLQAYNAYKRAQNSGQPRAQMPPEYNEWLARSGADLSKGDPIRDASPEADEFLNRTIAKSKENDNPSAN